MRKIRGNEETKCQIKNLRMLVNVLPINGNIADMALNSKFSDFEDALQYFTAKENNMPAILTRNIKGYKVKDIIIQTAEEYLKETHSYIR